MSNVTSYLNDDRALLRGSQFLANESNWSEEMHRTREAFGHNEPSRQGAKVTYGWHVVLGFSPDEIDLNGGPLTPGDCMDYAARYASERYGGGPGSVGSYEAVWVLHHERCKDDGSSRYAVHMFVSRTDLDSGRRLCEGRGQAGVRARVETVRRLDEEYGLRQLQKGQRNVRTHAMQPTAEEKKMRARGIEPDKDYIRSCVKRRIGEISRDAPEGNRMRELAARLKEDGVAMTMSKDRRQVQFQREGSRYKVNGFRLGRGFSPAGLAAGLGIETAKAMERAAERDME